MCGAGQPCFRLRDIGRGHVAETEPDAGLIELLAQPPFVARRQLEQGPVAKDSAIGLGHSRQQRLLDLQKPGPLGLKIGLRALNIAFFTWPPEMSGWRTTKA